MACDTLIFFHSEVSIVDPPVSETKHTIVVNQGD